MTGAHVSIWLAVCQALKLNAAQTRGNIAARLVISGRCATRHEALRYVTALL